jgi:hypothetical protein
VGALVDYGPCYEKPDRQTGGSSEDRRDPYPNLIPVYEPHHRENGVRTAANRRIARTWTAATTTDHGPTVSPDDARHDDRTAAIYQGSPSTCHAQSPAPF